MHQVEPIMKEKNTAIYARPNIKSITYDILIDKKQFYDIGIWSTMDMQNTSLMVQ